MHDTKAGELGSILEYAADVLDIPEALHRELEASYTEVGEWLGAEDSPLQANAPRVFPQGSARLGTVNRPVVPEEEPDFDGVCRLELQKQSISQQELMERVGSRLKEHEAYLKILESRRRCWTLTFDGYHIDILPAIPDPEDRHIEALLITDRDFRDWQHTNPIAFADWFLGRAGFAEARQQEAIQLEADVAEVPYWKVKTQLQRIVQLLKRHRDLAFLKDGDDKPASIIVTTLAALAYQPAPALFTALQECVRRMPTYFERRNGTYWIQNPVNSQENFADRWKQHPQRAQECLEWLQHLERDLATLLRKQGIPAVTDSLSAMIGPVVSKAAIGRDGTAAQQAREAGKLRMERGTGRLNISTGKTIPKHTFYGDDA